LSAEGAHRRRRRLEGVARRDGIVRARRRRWRPNVRRARCIDRRREAPRKPPDLERLEYRWMGANPSLGPSEQKERQMTNDKDPVRAQPERRTWTRPQLRYVGDVADVLQGGGGKLTASSADPGEPRKPTGQG